MISLGLNMLSWCYMKAGNHYKENGKLRAKQSEEGFHRCASAMLIVHPFVSLCLSVSLSGFIDVYFFACLCILHFMRLGKKVIY